jgi:hypothetical protein
MFSGRSLFTSNSRHCEPLGEAIFFTQHIQIASGKTLAMTPKKSDAIADAT